MPTQRGYFLIADITGYTQYLSESELDHAQQILTSLLDLLIRNTRPPLVISRLAGDAVISYGLDERFLQSQTFVETIEQTYVAFRRAIELMVRNTTCPCNACRNIGSLDLKFFVHHGEFGIQKLDAHEELVGSDVNLIHRLLKNHVAERTGFNAYVLYTDAAIGALGLAETTSAFRPHEESYEHLGKVGTWVQDLRPVWEARRHDVQVRIEPDQVLARGEIEIAMPPERVWDYMIQPEHFNVLIKGERLAIANRVAGRIAVGSVYECYHGGGMVAQTILEWHPFERVTAQFAMPVPVKGVTGLMELLLVPSAAGTRLVQVFSKSRGPLLGRLPADVALRAMTRTIEHDLGEFARHVEADLAAHGGAGEETGIAAETISAAVLASLRQPGAAAGVPAG